MIKKHWLRNLAFLIVVVIVSLTIGISLNAFRDQSLSLFPVAPEMIELEAVVEAFENGQATFIDAREEPFYHTGHIPNALNLPRSEKGTFGGDVDKNLKLIVYCSEPACQDSLIVARRLMRQEYKEVMVFKGGWEEWQAASLPEETKE